MHNQHPNPFDPKTVMITVNLNTGIQVVGDHAIPNRIFDLVAHIIAERHATFRRDLESNDFVELTLQKVHDAGHFVFTRKGCTLAELLVSPTGPNVPAWAHILKHFNQLLASHAVLAFVPGIKGPPPGPWCAVILHQDFAEHDFTLLPDLIAILPEAYRRLHAPDRINPTRN